MANDVLKKKFLSAARAAVRAEREIRRKSFNVFSMCGVDHYENRHSQILKTFLDPQGPCGSIFLKEFFRLQSIDFRITGRTHADTELSTEYGRMDVCIMDETENWCVVIENKVYAGEQRKQIARYGKYLKRFANSRLFFLTRTGYKSSTASIVEYTPISYVKDISSWVDRSIKKCEQRKRIEPFVAEVLRQYKQHIQTIAEMPMNTKEAERLERMAKKDFKKFQDLCEDYKVLVKIRAKVEKKIQQEIAAGVEKLVNGKLEGGTCALKKGGCIDASLTAQETGFEFFVNKCNLMIRLTAGSPNCDDMFVGVTKEESWRNRRNIRALCSSSSWKENKWWFLRECNAARCWDSDFYDHWQKSEGFRVAVKTEIAQLILEIVKACV